MSPRLILSLVAGLLPAGSVKNVLLRSLGHGIGRGARVAPVLIWRVERIDLGPRASIGPGNVLRDLRSFELGARAEVGQWNWFSAAPSLVARADSEGAGRFRLGDDAALTSRHYVDCSGGVGIGALSTVAGVRSTFITHGIQWTENRQSVGGITIGTACLISSTVCITPGTVLPDRSVVGMGATVSGVHEDPASLLVAPRATAVKRGLRGRYFDRVRGPSD